jgi:hypothetical protein
MEKGGRPVSGGQQILLVARGGGCTRVGRMFGLLYKHAVLE